MLSTSWYVTVKLWKVYITNSYSCRKFNPEIFYIGLLHYQLLFTDSYNVVAQINSIVESLQVDILPQQTPLMTVSRHIQTSPQRPCIIIFVCCLLGIITSLFLQLCLNFLSFMSPLCCNCLYTVCTAIGGVA